MIPMPDTAFARFWARLPAATKQSFFAGVVLGLVCHLYLFTFSFPITMPSFISSSATMARLPGAGFCHWCWRGTAITTCRGCRVF